MKRHRALLPKGSRVRARYHDGFGHFKTVEGTVHGYDLRTEEIFIHDGTHVVPIYLEWAQTIEEVRPSAQN